MKDNETIYSNHTECGDTRQRLGQTRRGDKILYHCFNCGYAPAPVPVKSYKQPKEFRKKTNLTIPADTSYIIQEWPVYARHWLMQYGITMEEIRQHKICYSKHWDRVILPIYDGDGLLTVQARALLPDRKPKYLTITRPGVGHRPLWVHPKTDYDTIVITEDILSAIRVSRLPKIKGVSTLGTGIDLHGVNFIKYLSPSKVYIFYDHDNAEVKRIEIKVKNILALSLGVDIVVIREGRDPKELTDAELKELLIR